MSKLIEQLYSRPSVIIEKCAKKFKDGLWYHVFVEKQKCQFKLTRAYSLFRLVEFVRFFALYCVLPFMVNKGYHNIIY